MAHNPFFSDEVAKAAVDAAAAKCNGGFLKIYSGAQPTDANTAIGAQVLLATLGLNGTAFAASVASGTAGSKIVTAVANAISDDTSADATGTAAWFRVVKADGTSICFDGTIAATGGTADLLLASTSIVAAEDVSVTSFSITMTE
ncbi:MAG TPA: hypothetical protein VGI71_23895 [Scandinavium sp.]|jgi:hypothetical protein